MDPEFLRMLQSMALVEKAPCFQSKKYDLTSLELKHPENVIVVASPTGQSPLPAPGERRMTKLSAAIKSAVQEAANGGKKRCSILVHEGMYIDAFGRFPHTMVPNDFSLEIVGVNDVRIIFQFKNFEIEDDLQKMGFVMHNKNLYLTLKNLLIYDRRHRPVHSTINIYQNVTMELIDVKINTPQSIAISAGIMPSHAATSISLVDCTFRECWKSFNVHHGVKLWMNRCQLVDTLYCGGNLDDGASITASNSSFINFKSLLITGGKGSFQDCVFEGGWTLGTPCKCAKGLILTAESEVTIQRTTFDGFATAVYVENSKSVVTAQHCTIAANTYAAFYFGLNAGGRISDCRLLCKFVATIWNNVKKKVVMERNQLSSKKSPAKFMKDAISVDACHDFKRVDITRSECPPSSVPCSKERSQFTKVEKVELRARTMKENSSWSDEIDLQKHLEHHRDYFKHCGRCQKPEVNLQWRFKYCNGCRKVCYCSKECQVANWPDHKLICQKMSKK